LRIEKSQNINITHINITKHENIISGKHNIINSKTHYLEKQCLTEQYITKQYIPKQYKANHYTTELCLAKQY